MRNNLLLFNLYRIYKILLFYPLTGFVTMFLTAVSLPFIFFFGHNTGTFFGKTWARFYSFITPVFVKSYNRQKIDTKQPYVIVANYQSLFDIILLYGFLNINFRWIIKNELRMFPFLGIWCTMAGHVFVDPSNHKKNIASFNQAKTLIKKGSSLLFFPEGERSRTGELQSFKKGAFKLAVDMGIPVLPVTVVGTNAILPDESTALFPGTARLIIHNPIATKGYTLENIDDLVKIAYTVINLGLQKYGSRE